MGYRGYFPRDLWFIVCVPRMIHADVVLACGGVVHVFATLR